MATGEVFISHSHEDKRHADVLKDLLRRSIRDLGEIRSTSNPGNGIAMGKSLAKEIRKDISDASVFIALLSKRYLKSSYCMFELGIAWSDIQDTKDELLLLVCAPGTNLEEVDHPLADLTHLTWNSQADWHGFVRMVAKATDSKVLKKEVQYVIGDFTKEMD